MARVDRSWRLVVHPFARDLVFSTRLQVHRREIHDVGCSQLELDRSRIVVRYNPMSVVGATICDTRVKDHIIVVDNVEQPPPRVQ